MGFIHNDKKLVFVHIPKTGGISITEWFIKNDKPDDIHYFHKPISVLKEYMDDVSFIEYRKFAVVRNPWDRELSAYSKICMNQHKILSVDDFVNYILDKVEKWGERRLQTSYVTIDDVIHMDYVLRFENLQEDFSNMCSEIGVEANTKLLFENPSDHISYREFYDMDLKHLVEKFYQKDIETFNYTFGGL